MASSNNVVLIVGATGFVGHQITEGFLKNGKYEVRILAQPSSLKDDSKSKKLHELQAKGAKLVEGEIENVESLKKAFQGVQTVVSTVSGPAFAHQFNLITAAKEAGVKRLVPSEFGGDTAKVNLGFYGPKKGMRSALEASGLEWTYIITGGFYEYIPWLGLDIANLKATVVGDGNAIVSTTAVSDFAQVVPDVLLNPKSKNASVYLIGDNLSWNQVLEIYEKHLGKKFERNFIKPETLQEQIKADPNPFGTILQQIQLSLASGEGKITSQDQAQYSTYKFSTVAEWVAKNVPKQ